MSAHRAADCIRCAPIPTPLRLTDVAGEVEGMKLDMADLRRAVEYLIGAGVVLVIVVAALVGLLLVRAFGG